MIIDCNSCSARGTGCADCVITLLWGPPPAVAEPVEPRGCRMPDEAPEDRELRRAIGVLLDAGMLDPRDQASDSSWFMQESA